MSLINILFLFCLSLLLSKDVTAQQPLENHSPLDLKQQSIVAISAFTAKGDLAQLQPSINAGLHAGLTVNEIKEVMIQLYAYAGFPRSLNALQTLISVVKEREQKGIKDETGKAPNPLPANKTKLQLGTDNQTRLVGQPVKGEVYKFAPAIDQFLKEHLFGDIFGRDNLDWKTREIATIAALATLGGVESQLRGHFNVGRHNGLTEAQLINIVSIIRTKVGTREGNEAGKVLQTVLTENQENKTAETLHGDQVLSSLGHLKECTIFPKGDRITNNNFTGDAWLQQLIKSDSLNSIQVGSVSFEAGARTKWHSHPAGQIIIAIEGTGYYQERGSPKRTIRKGDVISCPPNLPHWHGASKQDEFIQIAITNTQKGAPLWLTAVTDEEYHQ